MTQTMDCSEARLSLGVYVLGAIDPDERAQVDIHLAGCPACRDELAELEGLPALLALVSTEEAIALAANDGPPVAEADVAVPTQVASDEPPAADADVAEAAEKDSDEPPAVKADVAAAAEKAGDEPPGAEADAGEMLGAVLDLTAARRRRRRREAILGVAAAVIIAAGVFGGLRITSAPAASPQASAYFPYAGPAGGPWDTSAGGANGVDVTVMYRSMGWGTQLAADVKGVRLGTKCQLWVIGPGNTRVLAGSWIADHNEGSVWYPASAAVSAAKVQGFVVTVGNTQSVTVDASLRRV